MENRPGGLNRSSGVAVDGKDITMVKVLLANGVMCESLPRAE
jgi:hypothetical protein